MGYTKQANRTLKFRSLTVSVFRADVHQKSTTKRTIFKNCSKKFLILISVGVGFAELSLAMMTFI